MELDDFVCLCFDVSKRKICNFIRVEKPKRAAQLSECFGAGTGCGWCRTYLKQLFAEETQGDPATEGPTAEQYARNRARYIQAGGGTPPPGKKPMEGLLE